MSNPDAAPILELIDAFRKSKTMFTALMLGVFELLEDGPIDAAGLAEAIRAQPEPLERLLEACVCLGLLECGGNGFRNSDLAKAYLVQSSPNTLAGYIKYSDEALYPMWGNLSGAIREGTHRWQETFGLSGNALFEHFFHTDEATRTFLTGMHGFGMLSSPAVVRAFDLSRFRHLVDLGGGRLRGLARDERDQDRVLRGRRRRPCGGRAHWPPANSTRTCARPCSSFLA